MIQIMCRMQITRLWMMIKNKNYFTLLLVFFYFNLSFSNDIYIDSSSEKNGSLKIYYDSSDSVIPKYVFPVYIMIELYDSAGKSLNQISSTMVRAYWKGSDWWLFELIPPKNTVTADVEFSASNSGLDSQSENFTFNLNNLQNTEDNLLSSAKQLIIDKNYKDGILILNDIIESNPDSDLAAECIYIISEVYLNDFNEYEISTIFLKDIIENYSHTSVAKKSIFSLAYIYANYLDYYTDAIELYEKFKNTYPSDDLIPSIDYELDVLRNIK